MKRVLQRLAKFVVYSAAGIVILLAIAVGLFRLFLPRLPEYQEDIKDWASTAIGMRVEFSGMDARWGLQGPEVEFYDAELLTADATARIVDAEVVSIGVGLLRLLMDRKVVVDRVVISNTDVEVRQLDDGQWRFQGAALEELLPERRPRTSSVGDFEILGEDIALHFLQPGDERPRVFFVDTASVRRDDARLEIDADVTLPEELGRRASLLLTRESGEAGASRRWDASAKIDDLKLAGVSALRLPKQVGFTAGQGDADVSVAWRDGTVRSAAADVAFRDVQAQDEPPFSLVGRFAYQRGDDGWLIASTDYALNTPRGRWPSSSIRVEAGTNAEGEVGMLDVRANYLKLDDALLALPWLTEEQRVLLEAYDPTGEIRDLALTLGGIGGDALRYDVAATLTGVGFAAVDDKPGVRAFTGNIRADRSGGRVELDAPGMSITYPRFLGQPARLDEASGTLIWRRSNNRTTLLSDSIVLRNPDFTVETNIEIAFADDRGAPIVDLAASWSISDLATAKRYIPFIPRIPNTSEWFQRAILGGRIPSGTARLYGPLDKWPFDGGEGRFFVEANVEDARLKYLPRWPEARIIDAVLAVENMRLYTERNRIATVGTEVANARIELTDFREPVFRLESISTGSIDSVRRLLIESPLGEDVFGGRLDDVSVEGDGSFSLDLQVPIREPDALAFTARLQLNDARMALDGFPAPLTDVSGIVTVAKEDIGSEALGGTFLGRPVDIELMSAPESLSGYRIIAAASGIATAAGLIEELGIPLGGRLAGEAPYDARLLFPRGSEVAPAPFSIEIDSGLVGLGIDLPEPAFKGAPDRLPVSARLDFPAGEERIVTIGTAEGQLSWQIDFEKASGAWDLDRGIVRVARGDAQPVQEMPETRGLHFRGEAERIRFDEWLDLSRDGDGTGLGERIRSADMRVGHLHILGQHLVDHSYRVDRSAFDWLVQVDGPEASGSVVVPYDFQSGRELVLDMERLVLPGDEETAGEAEDNVDPRTLPTIIVRAKQFALGERHLGNVEATFRHTANGLQAEQITATDETFDISGSGGWIVNQRDPRGSRSYVAATLASRNVERTMQRLGYDPGIVSDDLAMELDLSWSGGPREEFLGSLDGEVAVRIGSGQLNEVDPGAGRMFGLLSVVALPRRLALDFRDVFSKGFGFDRISGTFRIDDGVTYTCDLSLEGPAANIGIVGRSGLVTQDYNQAAVVSANFGNTLPVVGGVLGGPQVAAVMLVFSQLFKKPLQEATEVYYSIDGAWDAPAIDRSDAEAFAETASNANCIADAS